MHYKHSQVRSQKFALGWLFWPPEANGVVGAEPPAAGAWGFGGKAPSRRRHSARKFCVFLQK